MTAKKLLRIGTRRSPLAMWQAEYVRDHLKAAHAGLEVELVPIETKGDKILDVALSKVGGKGLFVKELEVALLEKRVDICVHSTKDMPGDLPEGLGLVAFPPRADPRDALVLGGHGGLKGLRHGARVGTSSLRRQAQLLNVRPDLEIVSVRGNIQTRMKKVEELGLDCVVLASAGIERMAEAEKIGHRFDPDEMLPAAAQGILSIEARLGDDDTLALVEVLDDAAARTAALCERAFLKALGGGCQVPIAAYCTEENGRLTLRGLVAHPSGSLLVRGCRQGPQDDPHGLGEALGHEVLATGGRRILVEVGLAEGGAPHVVGMGAPGLGGDLAGRTAVVARDDAPDDNVSLRLLARGADVIPLHLMKLDEPDDGSALEAAVRSLGSFDVLAFTSSAAVERTFDKMAAADVDLRHLRHDALIAAVGEATRRSLIERGAHVDVVGEQGGADLADAIAAARPITGARVLFPRAQGGREALNEALTAKGADVVVVDAYRSVPMDSAAAHVEAALSRAPAGSALVLTSPRRVEVLAASLGSAAKERLGGLALVAIGETTAEAIRAAGFGEPRIAESPTPAGIAAVVRTLSLGALMAIVLLGLLGCPSLSIAEQAAGYFNLPDAADFSYESTTGLAEVHSYTREDVEGEEERWVYARTARRGGFLEDDATLLFEVNDDRELLITRYYDCLTRCGELSTAIVVFDSWPLEGGQQTETSTLVTLTRNGDPDGSQTEVHRFAVGEPTATTVPAGTFDEAFPVVWTRTIDGASSSASFVFAPEVGFIVHEDFAGIRFELTEGPLPETTETTDE